MVHLIKKQGIYVENMLKEELQKKGYGYFAGKYAALKEKNLNDSECRSGYAEQQYIFL